MDYASRKQMAEIDRIAPQNYRLTVSRMMENAGYQVADYMREQFERSQKIAVYAGKGNNGGDALAAARRLEQWGYEIEVICPFDLDGIRQEERQILEKLEVEFVEQSEDHDAVLEGLIGYNLKGDPREPFDELIETINNSDAHVVSIDVPAGLDVKENKFLDPSIDHDVALTLAAPFEAMKNLEGEHWLLDISIPREVYREAGLDIDPSSVFRDSSRVKLE